MALECTICDVPFLTKPGLKEHILSVHRETVNYRCKRCLTKFLVKSDLTHHLATEGHKLERYPHQLRNITVQKPVQILPDIPTQPTPLPTKRPITERYPKRPPPVKRQKVQTASTAATRISTGMQQKRSQSLTSSSWSDKEPASTTEQPSTSTNGLTSSNRADQEPVIYKRGPPISSRLGNYVIPKKLPSPAITIHATSEDEFSD